MSKLMKWLWAANFVWWWCLETYVTNLRHTWYNASSVHPNWHYGVFFIIYYFIFQNYLSQVLLQGQKDHLVNLNKYHTWTLKTYDRVKHTLIARFMGPTWGPSGADSSQVGSMLAPWSMELVPLSGTRNQFCMLMGHTALTTGSSEDNAMLILHQTRFI